MTTYLLWRAFVVRLGGASSVRGACTEDAEWKLIKLMRESTFLRGAKHTMQNISVRHQLISSSHKTKLSELSLMATYLLVCTSESCTSASTVWCFAARSRCCKAICAPRWWCSHPWSWNLRPPATSSFPSAGCRCRRASDASHLAEWSRSHTQVSWASSGLWQLPCGKSIYSALTAWLG